MNHPFPSRRSLLWIAISTVLVPQARALAQSTEQPEEIIVFGRNLELIGTAEAASEGSVGGRRSARSSDAAGRRASGGRSGHGRGAALRKRQGKPVLPARLQLGPRHGFHRDRRWCALEPALARPRPGLPRCKRIDAGDRRAHRLPQRALIARTSGTFRWPERLSLRRSIDSIRRSWRSRAAKMAGGGSRRRHGGARQAASSPESRSARPTTVPGSCRKTCSTRQRGASTRGLRTSARWR